MRIITGKYKGFHLFSVPGDRTRPTTDFVKEVMFGVLDLYDDDVVLDLYAGSGALGLEALSRGTLEANFVDSSQKAVQAIWKNIEKLGCQEATHVKKKKVASFLEETENQYDLILMDPPYRKDMVNRTLRIIFERSLLKPYGRILVEHAFDEPISDEWFEHRIYEKKMGETVITILSLEDK